MEVMMVVLAVLVGAGTALGIAGMYLLWLAYGRDE